MPDAEGVMSGEFDENLAEVLEDGDLNSLANDICGMVESDIDSRKEWADTFVKGLDVLGFKYEERTEPWEGCVRRVFYSACRGRHQVPSRDNE